LNKYAGIGEMTIRLEYENRVYGFLSTAIPKQFLTDEEEKSLLEEIAGDIAFALHNMEVEEEQAHAEQALKEYSEQLEEIVEERTKELRKEHEANIRNERLAVLGQLAGGVAHELRNPLGVIANAVYYLRTTLEEAGPKTREYFNIISSEIHNSERIIYDLLEFAKTRAPEIAEVELYPLISGILKKYPPPENIQLNNEISTKLPAALVDPQHLELALGNLIINGYQAMPEGGRLTVGASVEGNRVRISVTDTGCGIPEESMNKIFEPLFTSKLRGIGLGLPLSKNLVETNGGSIEVESDVDKGSAFSIVLPIWMEDVNLE